MGSFPGSRLCASLWVLRFLKHSEDRALAQALLKDSPASDHSIRLYDESSDAQTPFVFTERDRQLQKGSSHELLKPACFSHQWQRKAKESIAMFCTTKIVCINRQRSASQFLEATHTPWLAHGGSRAECTLAQFYSLSHALFSMQRKVRQKSGKECDTMLHSKILPAKSLGRTCLTKRNASAAIQATGAVSCSFFRTFHFSVVA